MRALTARPLLTALAVLGGAVLLVVGLLLGAALTGSGAAALPDEGSVDAGFARDMQVHHGQAVEMSVLVRDRSEDPRLRQVALDVLLTQQQQQGQMFGWLASWGLPQASQRAVMAWMSDEPFDEAGSDGMAGMDMGDAGPTVAADGTAQSPMVAMGLATTEQVAALEAADGVEAERIYLQLMIPHHRGGIEMASYARENATQPQVRRLAESMSTAQTAELTVLQDLLDARGGPVDLQG